MKIINLNIPKDKCGQNGLEDIKMENLQQMVLVVGKNGAGKSRLLNKVKYATEKQVLPNEERQLQADIMNYEKDIENINLEILTLTNSSNIESNRIPILNDRILQHQHHINRCKERLLNSFIVYEGDLTKRNVINFVPKNLNLIDPRSLNFNEVEQRSKKTIDTINVENLNETSLSRIQNLHTQYWNATHQNSTLDENQKESIISSYKELQKVTKELLGNEFKNDDLGNATIFGLSIGASQLSDGQKVLLQLAVAIHSHNLKLSETILLLDEPENHLHPAAIIDVIEKLKHAIPQGQIWIATHSISIIAHFFEESSVYYLEDGKVSKAGKGKTTVLESLLGDEERIRRQAEFLEEPVTHAMNIYAAQCLLPPSVVTTGVSDPQMQQIRDALSKFSDQNIKVLDFGAGKGRLITNLIETASDISYLTKRIDYIALDCDSENRTECEAQIKRVYEDTQHRWFQSHPDLSVQHNNESFDVIVMTNVLHEISPKDWLKYFGSDGELTKLLKKNGQLLLVEDQRIPVGETAHEFGFIVLDTVSLKELCKISGSDPQILEGSERDGRLKTHLISKEYLSRIDKNSIKSALDSHCRHSKSEIERLRLQNNKRESRLFAFWIHQYANTKLALESF